MTRFGDDLGERLPREVLSDLGRWTRYQSFRVFTWPWLLRRGLLFWPVAILAGFVYAAWHASGMGAWPDWPGLALRACVAALLAVSAGPALATLIRHRRFPLAVERVLIICAILGGLAIGWAAANWAAAYHAFLMEGYSGRAMNVSLFGQTIARFLRASIDASLFVLIFAGGGLAAIYYLGEERRIAQYAARHQLARIRAERDAADLRLAILQAQVEPHFLFNTLASVRSLIPTEPERAAQTIDALAAYLRASLPRLRDKGVEAATLGQQIDLCRGYLDLMNVRMGGRLEVRIDVGEAARAMAFPPLILLTLVENAVTHGIEPKVGGGAIAIAACVEEGRLVVKVEDDGVGLTPGSGPGLGLANVRGQLRDRFGDAADLEVASGPRGGAVARIRVPATAP